MSIESIYVKNFRNLEEQKFNLNPQLNFFIGDNGSGKSSILESVFFIGHGKSFRTTKSDMVCNFDHDEFAVHIKDESNASFGLSKHRSQANFIVKKNGSKLGKLSELANDFAIQIVTPESFKLFFGGAKERRRFLDLGMFHVEHSFGHAWKLFTKIHRQRNAVLKSKLTKEHLDYWTNEFVESSENLSLLREIYCKKLDSELEKWIAILLPEVADRVSLSYYKGWSKNRSLSDTLYEQKEKEYQLGYSQAGAQKFDLKFYVDGKSIELKLSRGQQKLFLVALTFAQMRLIEEVKQVKAILLVDDLGAELDSNSRKKFNTALNKLNCQVVITAIDVGALNPIISENENKKNYTMFHVKHGEILEIKEIG
ncbi:DNA replication/repair protein RecF [Thalassotalea sp. M1531]|uniref:DNA replication and repair protein RecF n=1 Tax=Thalassotalea algicola TaxID=2716224 RepID=A0A7Y0LA70_9GAMM|nr:DNA replication/repair protein RecF [Thalassotalea algicola]NMP30810.1 DNA replication/repair protein RecF [Thalassotalea algicola]